MHFSCATPFCQTVTQSIIRQKKKLMSYSLKVYYVDVHLSCKITIAPCLDKIQSFCKQHLEFLSSQIIVWQTVLQLKKVYRFIELFLATEIFSERRKIYPQSSTENVQSLLWYHQNVFLIAWVSIIEGIIFRASITYHIYPYTIVGSSVFSLNEKFYCISSFAYIPAVTGSMCKIIVFFSSLTIQIRWLSFAEQPSVTSKVLYLKNWG